MHLKGEEIFSLHELDFERWLTLTSIKTNYMQYKNIVHSVMLTKDTFIGSVSTEIKHSVPKPRI